MIFLIQYERKSGELVELTKYTDNRRADAQKARLERELELNRSKAGYELVLLEAKNLEDLKKTHSRYFEGPKTKNEILGNLLRDR